MILDLSDLLRAAIDERRERVSLREELEFARRYVEIEQARFGERLGVRWEVGDAALEATVPYLLLQPLLENAVRHGLSARPGPCAIEVSARRENGRLLLSVSDDGPGLPSGATLREGLGLRATRARLAELFGDRFRFALDNAPGGGCRVEIDVPVDAAADDAALAGATAP
jgi:sensor histidine kinase YesM